MDAVGMGGVTQGTALSPKSVPPLDSAVGKRESGRSRFTAFERPMDQIEGRLAIRTVGGKKPVRHPVCRIGGDVSFTSVYPAVLTTMRLGKEYFHKLVYRVSKVSGLCSWEVKVRKTISGQTLLTPAQQSSASNQHKHNLGGSCLGNVTRWLRGGAGRGAWPGRG